MSALPRTSLPCSLALAGLLAGSLAAQTDRSPAKALRRLRESLLATANATALAYAVRDETDSPLTRRLGGAFGGAGPRRAEVVLRRGVLWARVDDQELVIHGRRQIARVEHGSWRLRRGRLADGAPMPFLFDAELALEWLAENEPPLLRVHAGTLDDRPVEVFTFRARGEAAQELLDTGFFPDVAGGAAGGLVVIAGGRGRPMRPPTTVDLAVFVDPALRVVRRLRVRAIAEGNAGRVVFVGGAGRIQLGRPRGEEDPDEAQDRPNRPERYADGLPVVEPGENTTVRTLDVRFRDHGEARLPQLGEHARELLDLPGK